MRSYKVRCAAAVLGLRARKPDWRAATGPLLLAIAPRPMPRVLEPLLALLLAMPCPMRAHPARAEPSTLRLSLPIPLDSPTGQNIREFARQVQARTGGELRIDLQAEGRHYEEQEVVPAVTSGEIEMGATSLNQFAHAVPLTRAFLQPFLFNFDALVQAATTPESEIRTLIEKEILSWTNARVLWWQPYGSGVIFSKGLLAVDPAALAARPVGATDEQTGELIRICGGNLRRIGPSEVFGGLQSGSIHAAAVDIMNVRERDLWRVADTITNLRHAPSLFVIVINEQAWERLTDEQREILAELAQDAQAYMWARYATIRAEAYAFAAQKGLRIVEPSTADVAAWRACSAPLLEAYLERAGDDGPKLFATYGRLRTSPCCRDAAEDPPPAPR
jgi:C4-dicarboxylate-binding protein DctP